MTGADQHPASAPSAHAGSAAGGRPFQILALDGGGLKGLFSAALLAEFESDLRTTIVDHFDLITGTSTGGLIALALGAGLAPDAVVDFYVDKGPSIFRPGRLRPLRQLFRSKYDSGPLKSALEEVLGDRLLGQSVKRLVIPAYSLSENDVYLFKTPHHERLRRDGRELMVDVALATTAAPTFLPAHRLRNNRLIDGGVWANNPALVGVAEAVSMLGVPLADIRVLSLGTTDPVTSHAPSLDSGGAARWARPSSGVLLRAQALGHRHTAEHLVGPHNVVRVDANVPDGMFELDRLAADAIRGLAEGVSRRESPRVEPFTRTVAAPYQPSGATS